MIRQNDIEIVSDDEFAKAKIVHAKNKAERRAKKAKEQEAKKPSNEEFWKAFDEFDKVLNLIIIIAIVVGVVITGMLWLLGFLLIFAFMGLR
ncbi:MAG: hypothetical protein LC687_04645 [Actinobacteria bacterium]|nr:hypothetical protein [Actinomycetota bacterium]